MELHVLSDHGCRACLIVCYRHSGFRIPEWPAVLDVWPEVVMVRLPPQMNPMQGREYLVHASFPMILGAS